MSQEHESRSVPTVLPTTPATSESRPDATGVGTTRSRPTGHPRTAGLGCQPWRQGTATTRPSTSASAPPVRAARTGASGARTCLSGSGARSARTTAPTATPGPTSRTTTRARAPTAGARTASAGLSDSHGFLTSASRCGTARDPILKERIFGLTNPEGNHGEDAKEYWWYLDALPSHSWMRGATTTRRREFPYAAAVDENARARPRRARVRAARHRRLRRRPVLRRRPSTTPRPTPTTCCIRIAVTNHGPDAATLHVLPTAVVPQHVGVGSRRPRPAVDPAARPDRRDGHRPSRPPTLPRHADAARRDGDAARALFCDNETNDARLFGDGQPRPPCTRRTASTTTSSTAARRRVNPDRHRHEGRVLVPLWDSVPAGETARLSASGCARPAAPTASLVRRRLRRRRSAPAATEADEFYAELIAGRAPDEADRHVTRQAFAGLLWSKQLYHYDVRPLAGRRPGQPAAAEPRHARPQRATGAPRRRRHHVDARPVGVPVVRRVGPGLPLRSRSPTSTRRSPSTSCCCSAASGSSTRTARCRRTSGPSTTSTRRCTRGRRCSVFVDRRRAATATSSSRIFAQAAAQLHLVGQPQGRRRQQPLRGRLPRPGQHRPDRPVAPLPARLAGSSRPTARLDGVLLARHMLAIAARAARARRGRDDDIASKFLEHFLLHRRGDATASARATRCGTRRTASSTTCSSRARRAASRSGALDGRPAAAPRRRP